MNIMYVCKSCQKTINIIFLKKKELLNVSIYWLLCNFYSGHLDLPLFGCPSETFITYIALKTFELAGTVILHCKLNRNVGVHLVSLEDLFNKGRFISSLELRFLTCVELRSKTVCAKVPYELLPFT